MAEINQEFYRFVFKPIPGEIVLAHLYDLGFEAFEEKEDSMEGYLPAILYSETIKLKIQDIYPIAGVDLILPQNWNAIWEASFEPITIEDKVHIRASFHKPSALEYDIVIDPKMAFGTGHHATTFLVIREMIKLDMDRKKVMDFGCGSGVLAILAEKFGAESVKAIDHDIASIENSLENAKLNHCKRIEVVLSDFLSTETGVYDIILANITRDVLIQNSVEVRRLLISGGVGIYSGFLLQDLMKIEQHLRDHGFIPSAVEEKDGWCVIVFLKP